MLSSCHRLFLKVKAERGAGSRKWCKRRCLEEQRFYEMSKLKRQFRDLLKVNYFVSDIEVFIKVS